MPLDPISYSLYKRAVGALRLKIVDKGTFTPSGLGSEETVFETSVKGKYAGYISVRNLESGDEVTIYLYLKLLPDSPYELYDSATISGPATETIIPIYEVHVSYGLRVRLNQTAGTVRSYDYVIFKVQE